MKTLKGIILILLTWGVCISLNLLMSRIEFRSGVDYTLTSANLIGSVVFIVSWMLISVYCSKNKKLTIILMAIDLAGALFGFLCMLDRSYIIIIDFSYLLNYPYKRVFFGFENFMFDFFYKFQTLVMLGFGIITLLSYFWHKRNTEKVRKHILRKYLGSAKINMIMIWFT